MSSNVPIFLSIMNKFHNSIIDFDRPTLDIAFGGKIKIVNFLSNLIFRWYLSEVDVKYTVITTLVSKKKAFYLFDLAICYFWVANQLCT